MLRKIADFCRAGLRPVRHYADFKGRSRRTELGGYFFFFFLLAYGFLRIVVWLTYPGAEESTSTPFLVATLLPTVALFVRRMHDQGRSGWWVLLLLPLAAVRTWQSYSSGADFHLDTYGWLDQMPSGAVEVVAAVGGLCWLAFFGMIWLDPEKGGNRYGPDPRRLVPGDPDY